MRHLIKNEVLLDMANAAFRTHTSMTMVGAVNEEFKAETYVLIITKSDAMKLENLGVEFVQFEVVQKDFHQAE